MLSCNPPCWSPKPSPVSPLVPLSQLRVPAGPLNPPHVPAPCPDVSYVPAVPVSRPWRPRRPSRSRRPSRPRRLTRPRLTSLTSLPHVSDVPAPCLWRPSRHSRPRDCPRPPRPSRPSRPVPDVPDVLDILHLSTFASPKSRRLTFMYLTSPMWVVCCRPVTHKQLLLTNREFVSCWTWTRKFNPTYVTAEP